MRHLQKEDLALIFASAGWFLVLSGRYAISTLLVHIEASFHMDHAVAGTALTAMWFFYGLMQFPSGILSDVKGRKLTITLAMLTFAVAYLLIGISVHVLMFVAVLVMLGVGAGSFPTAGIAMLSDLFKENRGRALGIQSSVGSMAGLMPILAPLIAVYNWRFFFVGWAAVSLTCAYLTFALVPETTRLPSRVSVGERLKDGLSVFREGETLFIFAINLTVTITWMGFTSFYPTYLIEGKGFAELEAGICFALLSFGGFVLKPVVGSLADRYPPRYIVFGLSSMAATATALLVYTPAFPVALALSLPLSATTSIFLVNNAYLMHHWEVRGRGGKLGFYRSVTILVGSPTSALVGYAAHRYGFDLPFALLAALLALAATALLAYMEVQRRRRRREVPA
ncbi:MAG: MFS transporter [Candidatus Thermoplasmatota archaeon]|nr:MFS transporter [Candidatus Thermoplasmatota archaeon]